MRNQRLFGVVIAVLLGSSLLHQSPSSPQSVHHGSDHRLVAESHLGGTDIQLMSAALPADVQPTPLALGEESPVGLLRPVGIEHTLGTVDLASAAVPADEEHHTGLLRPAGTRFVKLAYVWMAYVAAHPPPPPPRPAPKPAPKAVAKAAPEPVPHPVVVAAPEVAPVAPATSAASGGVWAALRQCESGGNYAENTGNGYYGAYQFSPTTWHGLGYPGLPSAAAPAVQDRAAQQLQARSGWGQWPGCSSKLGL